MIKQTDSPAFEKASQTERITSMHTQADNEASFQLVIDILSDMVLKYLEKQALLEATIAFMEQESEEQLDFEMTSELLGTTEFRVLSVA